MFLVGRGSMSVLDKNDSKEIIPTRDYDINEEKLIKTVENIICGYIKEEGDDLSVRQLAVLIRVAQTPMVMTPLATDLGLSLSAVSRCVDALEKIKLAKRQKSGKFVTVYATALGQAKVGQLMANAIIKQ
jgi:DNA-binding MarR family transcriptional regulator